MTDTQKDKKIPASAGIFFVSHRLAPSTAIPAKAGISLFTLIFRLNSPSHSCEGRNFRRRAAAGNCAFVRLRRQFAPYGAEIPAFAGMGLKKEIPFARSANGFALRRKRFRLSPEWRHF
ncbi:MAG: hypothetical protein ACR2QC_02555 [Gammaproteobacteria bacterium]